MRVVSQQMSLPISDKLFLFNQNDCCSLFLYENGTEVYMTLLSFIESGLENDEFCIFAYDNTEGKLHPEDVLQKYVKADKLHLLPMVNGNISQGIENINSKVWTLCRRVKPGNGKALRVAIDFGSLLTRSTLDSAIDCMRGVLQKRRGETRLAWSRARYRRKIAKSTFPLQVITAFDADFLTGDATRRLLDLYENVMVLTQNEHRMSLLNYRPPEPPSLVPAEMFSMKALERFVKKHLEVIVLSLLLRNPMCGYDLIRTIYQKFHASLSQGTVYPLLYDLDRRGLLGVSKSGSSRAKVYALTEEGKRVAEDQIDDFISTQKYLLDSVRK